MQIQPIAPNIDPMLHQATADGELPGVVALLTDAHDTRYVGASGVRSLASDDPMTVDSVFWIASMTKAITSAAALQLLEQGRLSLDEPASRWFPELGRAQVLEGFDGDGKPLLRAPSRAITLHHLLTHTSGYGYEFFSADNLAFQKATGTPGVITCRNAVFGNPLLFDPGERWQYGMGIEPVGKIIEAVTGMRLGQYLTQHLLQPLGMQDTAFRLTESMRARLATTHNRGKDGKLKPVAMEIEQDPEFEMGGGGLYSTAQDYAQFLRLILNRGLHQGQRLLKESSVDLMLHNAIGDLRVVPLPSSIAPVTNPVDLYPGIEKTWSLAGMINEAPLASGRAAGSLMWAGLANTYFWVDPIHGIGGLYLTQVFPFADAAALRHLNDFETQAYQHLADA